MIWTGSNQQATADYFYWSLMRKYILVLGRQFSDIVIQRTQANNVIGNYRVPLDYGPKDKNIVRLRSDPDLDRPYSALLPQMTYEIVDIQPDPSRKLNAISKNVLRNPNNVNQLYVLYAPVPYNIFFKLYIYVKNFDDGAQILEQILPFFQPDFTPTVELIPAMNEIREIPIELMPGTQFEDMWDGDFKVRRMIVFTLSFRMRAFFYGPQKSKPMIKFIDINHRLGTPYGLVLGSVQLGGAVNSTSNTITLISNNVPGIPNIGNYYGQIDKEFVYVASGAGSNTLSVQRGALNTLANAHSANAWMIVQKDPGIAEYQQSQPGLTANGQPTTSVNNSISWQLIDINSDFGYCSEIYAGEND